MSRVYARFHEKGQGRALIEMARQYDPKNAVREFVTNSLDAMVPGDDKIGEISVVSFPNRRRVVVSDNGIGMGYDELTALPESIGYSGKAGKIDMRGEKGLGLLAFGSVGDVMHIISRTHNGGTPYGYIRWEIDETKGTIPCDYEELGPKEVEDFHGGFSNGTRVVMDMVNPHVMNKVLTISALTTWLRRLYTPALRNEIVDLKLGRVDSKNRGSPKMLTPIDFSKGGSLEAVEDGTYQIEIKNQEEPGDLEVLLFVDPEGVRDKVGVYSKDVLVYQSLAELAEFEKSLVWTSGKVSGYVNDRFNKLILGREGIERKRNAFKAWYNAVKELEERIRPLVEEKRKPQKRRKEEVYIKRVFDALADVWKDIKKTDIGQEYARSSEGEKVLVDGAEPTKERDGGERKPREDPIPGKPPGPGAFKGDPSGHPQKVVSRKGVPFGKAEPVEFPLSEIHLRSKLEDLLGVAPTLYLNSVHGDYKSRVDLNDNNIFMRYVLNLVAKEAAYYSVRKLEREGTLMGDRDEVVRVALQREETIKFLALDRLGIK
ncbi:MAG: hypothetical protein CMH63_02365 [Nanoarchaeota archaeon]|jgi:anti-sigma regulatory factor (Ser/Thr protein kinase)|nr:hypothetical protein [Nanoarchaeota archaeon]|tara:strand:- start:3903 stop:5534 length:1632 start_codon:yes stop_codon:yes gene_type:complete